MLHSRTSRAVVTALVVLSLGFSQVAATGKAPSKRSSGGLAVMNTGTTSGGGFVFHPYRCISDPNYVYSAFGGNTFFTGEYFIRIGWGTLEEVQIQRFLQLQSGDVFQLRNSSGTPIATETNTWAVGNTSGWTTPVQLDNGIWVTFTYLPLGNLEAGDYYFDLTASISAGSYGSTGDTGGTPPGPWVSVSNCHIHVS